MATLSSAQPDSSVSKFSAPPQGPDTDPEATETKEGTDYSDPDSQGEPAVMLTQAQMDAAGLTGAQPGDTFTVKITIADQSDDGTNIELEPGSAVKDMTPPMDDGSAPAAMTGKNSKIKGPSDFGMPQGLGTSPSVLNA